MARDHAEIAVACLGGMHEEGRRAGRGQRGRDLVADMPGLAHARDDDTTRCLDAQLAGRGEVFVQARFEGVDSACLDVDHLGRERQ